MRILATDRDAAVDQSAQLTRELDDSRARAERLRAQVRTLVSPQQSVQGMSERMRSMLRMAEDEVAEMLQRAEQRGHEEPARRRAEGGGHRRGRRARRPTPSACSPRPTPRPPRSGRAAEGRAGGGGERATTSGSRASRETAEREIAEARARLAAEQQEHAEAAPAPMRTPSGRRSDAWTESETRRHSGGGGFPHRDGPAPQGSAHRAHGRAARHPRGHRGDARARARRGQADGRGRAAGGGPDRGRRPGGRGSAARAAAAHRRAARGVAGRPRRSSSPRSDRSRASRIPSRPRRPPARPSSSRATPRSAPRATRADRARRSSRRHSRDRLDADRGRRAAATACRRPRPLRPPWRRHDAARWPSGSALPPGLRRAPGGPARRVPVPPVGDRAVVAPRATPPGAACPPR